jgi:hypothetical protein
MPSACCSGACFKPSEFTAKISARAPSIEFFGADLNSDQGWDRAVAGIDYVLHVASPVTAIDPKSEKTKGSGSMLWLTSQIYAQKQLENSAGAFA